jgi:hypothetical protein
MPDWSREEVEATVSSYLEMLGEELRARPYNKSEFRRRLKALLNNRDDGAIERKHQNISAVLIALGYPWIDGYKPLNNYQKLLLIIVEERLHRESWLQIATEAAVTNNNIQIPVLGDILGILEQPPSANDSVSPIYAREVGLKKVTTRNFLEIEARNRSLGVAGEEFILKYEHERLWREGKKQLAERVTHIARTEGDQAGYDILSYEIDGRERMIEVKTTRFGKSTPFFASRNEVHVSEWKQEHYHLYRLFRFAKQPKLFILPGPLTKSCALEPILFSASVA